jgi:hypothetical protein
VLTKKKPRDFYGTGTRDNTFSDVKKKEVKK